LYQLSNKGIRSFSAQPGETGEQNRDNLRKRTLQRFLTGTDSLIGHSAVSWHKLWRNLGATENQIQCLVLLDVEARIHEEAEEVEVWSPSYPRSLQTVWIGNNEQSV